MESESRDESIGVKSLWLRGLDVSQSTNQCAICTYQINRGAPFGSQQDEVPKDGDGLPRPKYSETQWCGTVETVDESKMRKHFQIRKCTKIGLERVRARYVMGCRTGENSC